jgi:two-component system, cell cycle sensor histidine kinase and response regulator CckA
MGPALTSDSTATLEERAPTILVVEDETVIATDLERTLRRMGYGVLRPVASADEALEAVQLYQPDLVLMDIRIQGDRDGIETASELQRLYGVPVIFLTAHSDPATLERAKMTRPLGFLLKPFRARDLHATVDMALHRHKAARKIVENERWLRTILNSINDAVVVSAEDGRMSLLNLRARELLRRTEEECVGAAIDDILILEGIGDAGPRASSLRASMLSGKAAQSAQEVMLVLPDGDKIVIDENSAPLLENGKVVGGVTVFRDVTERAALRRQAEVTNRLTALGTLAASVAHEVNNPLTVISTNLELVERWAQTGPANEVECAGREVDDAEFEVAVRDIRMSVDKIASLVTDLSGFGRPGPRGEQRGNVNNCIRWALSAVRSAFSGKTNIQVEARELPAVRLDERRIGQILINLLTNALQSLSTGAAENLVSLRAYQTDGFVVIEVSDTGGGIPTEVQKHIFEPFVTGRAATGGTGLGLFICQNIAVGAGGTLTFETRAGVGTTFQVTLPIIE